MNEDRIYIQTASNGVRCISGRYSTLFASGRLQI